VVRGSVPSAILDGRGLPSDGENGSQGSRVRSRDSKGLRFFGLSGMVYKGLTAVSIASIFDPALLDLEGAIAKNVVYLGRNE
jgi:hypothetical protein